MGDEDLIQAATVVLLRDGPAGIEVLMLRRNSRIAFGGAWVFPGGRVDDHEVVEGDELASARTAAAREVTEETGLVVDPDDLVPWSHWVPPVDPAVRSGGTLKRFATWFFVAASPNGDVAVDGGEIHEHRWLGPPAALDLRQRRQIELVPPTWVTLWDMQQHPSVAAVLDEARSRRPGRFHTRPIGRDPLTLAWAGDVAYDGADPEAPGPRNRLIMERTGWTYQRSAG
jgi:8-oxo-dGTP pyrophosphatase MutT (NUDIX family)